MQRDFGNATWSWNTTGLAAGTYQVGVWARQPGTARAYDSFGITTFALGVDNCVSSGLTPSSPAPQLRNTVITFTAAASGCASPRYQFWLLAPGGAWTSVRAYGTGNTWAFDSSQYPAGNFQIGVWTRQASSTSSHDSFAILSFAITSATGCVVSAVSADITSPQPIGASITFTAQQSNCTKQYKFWLLPPGGAWTVVKPYASSATWTWSSAGYAPGAYEVGAWEGSATAPSTYESFAITTFDLGVQTCTSASLVGPAQPQAPGTPLDFTAGATRCGAPQLEYWTLAPGGAWTMARAYGAAAWTWNTTGLATGSYQVGVWARQTGSTSAHDAYFIGTFELG
jgi:hypothetical protein